MEHTTDPSDIVVDFNPNTQMHRVINTDTLMVEGTWHQYFQEWIPVNRPTNQTMQR